VIAEGLTDQQIVDIAAYYAARGQSPPRSRTSDRPTEPEMKKITLTTTVLLTVAAVWGARAAAADIDAGQKTGETQCAACHARMARRRSIQATRRSPGNIPITSSRCSATIRAVRARTRSWVALRSPCQKNDVENVAAYFSSLPGPLTHHK